MRVPAETQHALAWIEAQSDPRRYLCISETLKLGRGEVALIEDDGLLVRIHRNGAYLAAPLTARAAAEMRELVGQPPIIGLMDSAFAGDIAPDKDFGSYTLWCRLQPEPVPASVLAPSADADALSFRLLDASFADAVAEQYRTMPRKDTVQHVEAGLVFGGFNAKSELVGFIGEHDESSMGMLEIYPEHRGRGYATQLEGMQTNRFLASGRTPFCQVAVGNVASERLQARLGLTQVPGEQCWISGPDR